MSKLTTEARNAILSARAKNRKAMTALIAGEVEVPKAIANHAKALETWYNAQLAPAKAPAKAAKKAA